MNKNQIVAEIGTKVLGYRRSLNEVGVEGTLENNVKTNSCYLMTRADNGKTIQVRFFTVVPVVEAVAEKVAGVPHAPARKAVYELTLAGKTRKEINAYLQEKFGEGKYVISRIMKAAREAMAGNNMLAA